MGLASPEGYLDTLQDDQTDVSLTAATGGGNNCTTTEAALGYRAAAAANNDTFDSIDDVYEQYADDQQQQLNKNNKNVNVSHLKTMTATPTREWEQNKIKLKFPKGSPTERYKMASLNLDSGIFAFDFVRRFLLLVQPNDLPLGDDILLIIFKKKCMKHKVFISLHRDRERHH